MDAAAFFDRDLADLCVRIVASICCTLHSLTWVSSLPLANSRAFVLDHETELTIWKWPYIRAISSQDMRCQMQIELSSLPHRMRRSFRPPNAGLRM